MPISDLVAGLRIDLADEQSELFADGTLERCVRKAIFRVAQDLDTSITVTGDEISPEPDAATANLISLLSQIHACQVMRAATANAFSFSSADKRVDKSGQPAQWAKLEESLTATYNQALKALRPQAAVGEDNYLITPAGLSPVIYEQGITLDVIDS